MNWGKGITIVLIIFVIASISFLIYSTTLDWSLVEDDYYPKELKHEDVLVKKRNYNALVEKINIELTTTDLSVKFPSQFQGKITGGHIQVYRPSDKKLDYMVPVQTDSSMVQLIPRGKLKHGNYVVKVEWYATGKGFYKEQELFIP